MGACACFGDLSDRSDPMSGASQPPGDPDINVIVRLDENLDIALQTWKGSTLLQLKDQLRKAFKKSAQGGDDAGDYIYGNVSLFGFSDDGQSEWQ